MPRWNALLLLGFTLGCAAKPASDNLDPAAARAAIQQANEAYVKGAMAGDAKGMTAFLADDFISMSVDGTPDLVGRANNEADVLKRISARTAVLVELRVTSDTVDVRGDHAYEVGRSLAVRQPKNAPAKRDTSETRYITFWRKQQDGSWKATRDFTAPITRPRR